MSRVYTYYKRVLIAMLIIFIFAFLCALAFRFYRNSRYEIAKAMIENCEFDEAKDRFERLGEDYLDCASYLSLLSAIDSIENRKYAEAIETLTTLDNLKEAQIWLFEAKYKYAQQLYTERNFLEAIGLFVQLANEPNFEVTSDLEKWLRDSKFAYAQQLYADKNFVDAIRVISELESDDETIKLLNQSKYAYGQQLYSQKDFLSAISYFDELGGFEDSPDLLNKSKYALALELMDQNRPLAALDYFLDLGDYERSAQYVDDVLDSGIDVDAERLYKAAQVHLEKGLYWRALAEFESTNGYNDSDEYIRKTTTLLRQSLSTTVSVGQKYTVAINSVGEAYTTGFDPAGRSNVTGWKDLVSIAGFSDVTAGLKSDGTVITTSKAINNEIQKSDSPWAEADIVAISTGNAYVIGLNWDGTLRSAGHDAGDGQREVDDWENIIAIATGWRHTVGLNSSGNVLITGYGSARQLNQMQSSKEAWTDIVAIAAGGGDDVGKGHTVGLRKDGRVVAVGDNSFNQCDVDSWKDIVAIAAGDWFTMGMDKYGKIFITKPNQEIINKYNLYTDVWNVETWSDTGVIAIAAGGGSAVGLYEYGKVITAGYGAHNQKKNANKWEDIMVYSNVDQNE